MPGGGGGGGGSLFTSRRFEVLVVQTCHLYPTGKSCSRCAHICRGIFNILVTLTWIPDVCKRRRTGGTEYIERIVVAVDMASDGETTATLSYSVIHPFTDSLTHSVTHSPVSYSLSYSPIHSLTTHFLTPHLFTHSPIHSPPISSLPTYLPTHSFTHNSCTHCLLKCLIPTKTRVIVYRRASGLLLPV